MINRNVIIGAVIAGVLAVGTSVAVLVSSSETPDKIDLSSIHTAETPTEAPETTAPPETTTQAPTQAQTWNEYIEETKQNRYGSRRLQLPSPEFYVIFTGERQEKPEYLSLSEEFFGGEKEFLDAKVKMLYGDGDGDIISQYVDFTKVYQEQARLLGRTVEAVRETIRICKNKDVLREYLSTHEKEVVSIMMALFDQEKAVEQFGYEREQKGREEGGFEMARRTAANMFKDGEPIDKIARFLEFPPETILSWVGKV